MLGRLARDGYKVGLTVAAIQPVEGWREGYSALFELAAAELAGAPDLDLTAELITHRGGCPRPGCFTGRGPSPRAMGSPRDPSKQCWS